MNPFFFSIYFYRQTAEDISFFRPSMSKGRDRDQWKEEKYNRNAFFFRILYKSCLLPTKLRRKFLKFLSFDPKGIRYYREYLMERRTCWEITYGYIERFNNKIETSSLGALEYKRRTKHNRLSLYKQRRTSSHDHYHCSNR